MRTLQHYGTGGYNASAFNYSTIHYNSTHTYQHIVVYGATMHNSVVAYTYIIAQRSTCALVSAVDAGPVLHIYFITHFNKVHIAPHYGVEPKATVIAGLHIADNSGVGRYKIVFAKRRRNAVNRKYDGHKKFKINWLK
jgi:hypothetical protein